MPSGIIHYCQETQLANGIIHLRLIDNSLHAADDLLDFFDRYIASLEPHQAHAPLLLLIEPSPIGIPPMAYMSRCYQDLLKLHETKQFHARIAYLYGSNVLLTVVNAMFRVIRNAQYVERRFFRPQEFAQAEAWLLEGKP